jgi:hypothetical protein
VKVVLFSMDVRGTIVVVTMRVTILVIMRMTMMIVIFLLALRNGEYTTP